MKNRCIIYADHGLAAIVYMVDMKWGDIMEELTIEMLDEYVRTGKEKAGTIAALAQHLHGQKDLPSWEEIEELLNEDVPFVLRAQKLVEKTEGKIASAEKRGFATPLEIRQAKEQLLASSKITNLALDEVYGDLKALEEKV